MIALFLTTFLSCSDIVKIANKLTNVKMLTPEQKTEILLELKKVVPTCPLIIKSDEQK
jgi:hypothetical protein